MAGTDETPDGDGAPGIRTQAVHAGTDDMQPHGAVAVPIFQTWTYRFKDTAELRDHHTGVAHRMEYGRYGNRTQRAAEKKIAALGGAEEVGPVEATLAHLPRRSAGLERRLWAAQAAGQGRAGDDLGAPGRARSAASGRPAAGARRIRRGVPTGDDWRVSPSR